ncbi:PHD and RING finger domain-containing protein [Escovopsis weberi]|uniref:PHD and RING finger domain-containing protein n=1 Tax=Escovopsis weberi TaxID=150374 RepID=A0A0M8MYL5_ESCWE|nr:PHD and RING finger domain-containing protein [Escovopsis weberi]
MSFYVFACLYSSAEREDVLLLCDSCDAVYHTYCIGLDDVPEGDWYCMECAHLLRLNEEPDTAPASAAAAAETLPTRPHALRRQMPRSNRGFHVRTVARLKRARRQARNAEWQGAWGQFSGRFYEMSDLDLDNLDDEDEDMESFRRFQQLDRRELQRWQQRISIAQRLGAHESFANSIPPQISERLQPGSAASAVALPPPPPPVETRDERRAWGAFERVRDEQGSSPSTRKRKTRSITGSPVEPPSQEPERKLKRPRTRRLPHAEGAGAGATATAASASAGPFTSRVVNGAVSSSSSSRPGHVSPTDNEPTLIVSSLLKELEPNAQSDDEGAGAAPGWRHGPEASSPALSPTTSAYSSPRALSLTPPPLPSANGRPTSPTLSLSTHIEPIYPPANYSPSRHGNGSGSGSEHSDSESRPARSEGRPLELRQPRPRRAHQIPSRQEEGSSRWTMTQEEKRRINEIVKNALRPHWRAQRLTTEQYATINRDISRKLYDEVKDASSLDDKTRRSWEKRATQEVAQAVSELQA